MEFGRPAILVVTKDAKSLLITPALENFRAQVGDSFIITEDGYEPVSDFPKLLAELIL